MLDCIDSEIQREPGSNMLILAPPSDENELISSLDQIMKDAPEATPVVLVSSTHPVHRLLNTWRTQQGEFPPNIGLLSIGELVRSTSSQPSTIQIGNVWVRTVQENDLTGIGIAISDYISQWDDEPPLHLCFDAVDNLLTTVDLKTTFRFLHILTAQIQQTNSTAYYHLIPDEHTQQTINSLTPLFDEVLECGSATHD